MSARLLKKFLKEQELHQQQHHVEDDDEEEAAAESPDSENRPATNPFDLLNDDDVDQLQEDEPEIAGETVVGKDHKQELSVMKSMTGAISTSNQKSKKKKKKKCKAGLPSITKKVEEPLDDTLDALSLDANSSRHQLGPTKTKPETSKLCAGFVKQCAHSALQLDPKCLNPENELRRIFGYKVVKSFEKSNPDSSSRQVRGGRRGAHHSRKTILVSPSEHWPRWDGSLSMEFLETKDGYHHFRYVHSSYYDQAQRAFEAAKAIQDLNGIASILLYHPYHLDSLITMADYFKFVGEHQMSADAIAKSLYALECAWHPTFTPLQANCQLKINHETNKPMFTTFFTHMKNLDRRGCHRSALEVCKLLLSLDLDDPMGGMFCVDYFALRAEMYAWLEWFSEDCKSDRSLWLFPSFSYSLAICRLYLEREEPSKDDDTSVRKSSSADLMKQALMLHPSVLQKLVAKVPLKDQAWTNILKHAFFQSEKTGSPSLDHLINIYVERSYIIWRLPDLQKLLRNSALQVIETLEHSSSDAKDWACVRKEAFSSENNEYGHLLVSDFSDTVPTLPPENLQNFMVDPGMREAEQNGGQIAYPLDGGPAPHDVANRNALAVLFESMLPLVDYGGRGDEGGNEGNQVNGHEQDD
ncbi:NULP1-RELATED [Salix purpurea]|uniref:NULP1-RELATED n=2 Tax=Salix purpurea TaxID=77065 RepID=A0A9Q0PDZ7_SALPP|nr:NULP1-RELATED [Salix purpurea]